MIEVKGIAPDMIANNLEPFEPTHPGELLKDELEYRGLSQEQVATDMDVPYIVLHNVVNGRRAIDAPLALLCEQALDIPAAMLLHLQADYDVYMTKHDHSFSQRLAKVRRIAAVL